MKLLEERATEMSVLGVENVDEIIGWSQVVIRLIERVSRRVVDDSSS